MKSKTARSKKTKKKTPRAISTTRILRTSSVKKPKRRMKKQNLRQFRRYPLSGIWVKEYSKDYIYSLEALNMSEGGVFLKGVLKSKGPVSTLNLSLGKNTNLSIEAQPVYDRVSSKEQGTGYQFLNLTKDQSKLLRNFLRNLD
jgi:hypothetical protein